MKPSVDALRAEIRPLLAHVRQGGILGRASSGTRRVEQISSNDLRESLRETPNAICDVDGESIADLDWRYIYEPVQRIDNPQVGVSVFDDVASMVAFDEPWEINEAVTLNTSGLDGVMTRWVMIADPDFLANGTTVLDSFESYGRFAFISSPGQQGPAGPAGASGPEGPAGPPGDPVRITWTQAVAAAVWTIDHNQGKKPYVEIENSLGRRVVADVQNPTLDRVEIYFGSAKTGTAILYF